MTNNTYRKKHSTSTLGLDTTLGYNTKQQAAKPEELRTLTPIVTTNLPTHFKIQPFNCHILGTIVLVLVI